MFKTWHNIRPIRFIHTINEAQQLCSSTSHNGVTLMSLIYATADEADANMF